LSPTPSATPARSAFTVNLLAPEPANGHWLPWFFSQWQPGVGEPFHLGERADSTVDVNDLCVSNLRSTWDARASCKRFTVSVRSDGWLAAFLRWDPSAPGFDPSLSGDVVLVAPDGRFAASDWQHTEESIDALVHPGEYGVLVMSYVPATLPFQIRVELRSSTFSVQPPPPIDRPSGGV
jgi:hypothetical protein